MYVHPNIQFIMLRVKLKRVSPNSFVKWRLPRQMFKQLCQMAKCEWKKVYYQWFLACLETVTRVRVFRVAMVNTSIEARLLFGSILPSSVPWFLWHLVASKTMSAVCNAHLYNDIISRRRQDCKRLKTYLYKEYFIFTSAAGFWNPNVDRCW